MAIINYVFTDAALQNPFDDASDLVDIDAPNGSNDYTVFYVGTATAGNKLQAASDPGVDDIAVSVADDSPGSGVESAHIKLATSQAGLASAVAGDPVNLGTTINYGTPQEVYVQWDNSVLTDTDISTEISLSLSAIAESAI